MEFKILFNRNKKQNESKPIEKSATFVNPFPKGFTPLNLTSQNSRELVQAIYQKNVDMFAIVNYISAICSDMVINSKHERADKEIPNSQIKELFNNPNEFDDGVNFWKNVFASFFVNGNSFINKIKPVGYSKYTKLYGLNGSKVYPITNYSTDEYGTLQYNTDTRNLVLTKYNELLDTQFLPYEVEEIIQIKDSSLSNRLLGDSRLFTALKNANILNSLDDTMQTVLGQGGALGMIKRTVRNNELAGIDPDEKQRIIDNFYSYGVGNGKKPIMFTSEDLNYVRILTAINEFMPVEINEIQLDKICMAVGGVPSALFKSSDTTFTNLDTAQKILYTNVCIPVVNLVLSNMSIGLELPKNEKLCIDYSKIECLQSDKKTEVEIEKLEQDLIIQQLDKEIISIDEAKKILYETEDND